MRKITQETSEKMVIKQWLRMNGWFVIHHLAGIGVYPGMPDLQAVKDGVVLMIEVKAKNGRQSEAQRIFQTTWQEHGGNYLYGGFDEVEQFVTKGR